MKDKRERQQMTANAPIDGADVRTERAPLGDFPQSKLSSVLELLRSDLQASEVSVEELLSTLVRSRVSDADAEVLREFYESLEAATDLDSVDVARLIELLYVTDHGPLLAKYRIVHPSYRIFDDHYENAVTPSGTVPSVRPRAPHRQWRFLDKTIGFPIGVAASGLTMNAASAQRLFRSGYNIVTYKTVRSQARQPHERPNWAVANGLAQLSGSDRTIPAVVTDTSLHRAITMGNASTVNSFGVPSPGPEEWIDDVAQAARSAADDQLLICSVLGDVYEPGEGADDVVADFVRVATMAASTGVGAIELNLSCPNTLLEGKAKPPLCDDISLTAQIVHRVRESLPADVRLGIKLSWMPRRELRTLLEACGEAIDFVTGINTAQRAIHSSDGGEFFSGREVAGVGGHAIADMAVEFVSAADEYRRSHGASFSIIGVGGVTDPESFERLYNAGADVVQSVSGVLLNSLLADDCIRSLRLTLPFEPAQRLRETILRLTDSVPTPSWVYTTELPQPAAVTFRFMDNLIHEGEIVEVDNGRLRHFVRSTLHGHELVR